MCFGNRWVSGGNARYAAFARRARMLFVKPGDTFCSWIAIGIPSSEAAKRTGPET